MPGGVAEVLVIFRKATPTAAQIRAGNYPKRKVAWNGLTISIENERGSVRRGTDRTGKTWSTQMRHAYGYIKGSLGVDKDQVDCYLGPKLKSAPMVYVVHQRQAGDWDRYDEDKCMLGFPDEAAAQRAFLAHYDDPRFLGPITAMPVAEFVAKVKATADRPRMLKARGWWGPAHGGDHRPQAAHQDGEGGSAGPGDQQLPSSAGISSLEEAQAYWQKYLGGKTMSLTVHSGKRQIPILVRFDLENDHAFTNEDIDDSGQKTGHRTFSLKRAHAIDRIPSVITYPKVRLRNFGADLLLERRINGEHYTVVLTWRDEAKVYEFHSAHFKPVVEVDRLMRQREPGKNKGPLQMMKSGPLTVFAGLEAAQQRDHSPRWLPPLRAGNGMHNVSIVHLVLVRNLKQRS